MKKDRLTLLLLGGCIVLLSVLALYYKRGWNVVEGQLREISGNVDLINSVMHDLGGLYGRTRGGIILTQLASQDENLLVVFGDSIVEQMYYPATAGHNLLNSGISGSKVLDSKPFLEKVLAGSKGPLVVIAMGANDAFGGTVARPDDFAAGYEALARLVLASGRRLVLATLTPLETTKVGAGHFDPASLALYNVRIREIGARLGVVVADVNAVLARRLADHPGPFTVDGVHLDAAAASVWRETVYAAIAEALARPAS